MGREPVQIVIGRKAQIGLKVLASLVLLACVAMFLGGVLPIFASTDSPVQYYGDDARIQVNVINESITFTSNDTWYAFANTPVTRVDTVGNSTILNVTAANYTFNTTHIQFIGTASNTSLSGGDFNVSYLYLDGYINFTIYAPDNNTVYFNKTHLLGMNPFLNVSTNASFRYCAYTPWLNGTYFNLVNSSLTNKTWSNTTSNWLWDTVVNNTWVNLSFMCHNGTNTTTLKATYAIGNFSFTNSSLFRFRVQATTTNTPTLVSGYTNNTYYKSAPIANISTAEGAANCSIIINGTAAGTSTSSVLMQNTTVMSGTVYWTNQTTLNAQILQNTSYFTGLPYNVTFVCRDAFMNASWYNASTSTGYQYIWIDGSLPSSGNVTYNGNVTSNWTAVYAPGNAFTFNVTATDTFSEISTARFNISSSAVNYTATRITGTNNFSVTIDVPVGYHSFKWFINDSADNWNSSATYLFNVSQGVSNISLWIGGGTGTEGNASIVQGDTLNLTASINTSYNVTLELNATLSPGWANKTSSVTSITNTSNATSYTAASFYNITAHFAGDLNYTGDVQTWWLNVTARPATVTTTTQGSASSATSTSADKVVKSFTSIIPGVVKTISELDLLSDKTRLTEMQLEVKSRVTSVEMTVESLAAKPSEASAGAASKVYKYMAISFTNIAADNIQSAKIKFKVEKSWLTQNVLVAANVALYRYANGVWNKLGTTKTSEDTLYVYYEAVTPGFSYFAIGVEQAVAATTTTTVPPVQPAATTTTAPVTAVTTTIPTEGTQWSDYSIIIAIIVLIAAIVIVFWKFKLIKF